jgi:hypothetical protein
MLRNTGYQATWIEGFGFGDYNYPNGGMYYWLNCFFRGQTKEFNGEGVSIGGVSQDCDYSASNVKTYKNDELNFQQGYKDGQLTISLPDKLYSNLTTIEMYDLNGRIVRKIKMFSNPTIINMSDLPDGVYIVTLVYQDKRISEKIVKY